MEQQMVVTQRDCPARLVPAGTKISIPKNTFLTITQALGGNYTVKVNGNLARIDGTDADAIGKEPQIFNFEAPEDGSINESQIWETLKTIYDPEIPVNLVDLGLIYDVRLEQSNQRVLVDMTLTAPACGMGPVLVSDVKYRLAKVPNVREVFVELVFDPPWSKAMMSEEAQLMTGMFF